MLPQGLARRGEGRLLPPAVEKPRAQLGLQLAHLFAEGRLREVELGGRAREAALAGGLEEVFELVEVHRYFRH
jgi:hypothetical protein